MGTKSKMTNEVLKKALNQAGDQRTADVKLLRDGLTVILRDRMRCLHVNGYSQTEEDPYVRSLESRMKDMKSEHLESSLTWRAELSMKQTEVERAKADLRHSMEREQDTARKMRLCERQLDIEVKKNERMKKETDKEREKMQKEFETKRKSLEEKLAKSEKALQETKVSENQLRKKFDAANHAKNKMEA